MRPGHSPSRQTADRHAQGSGRSSLNRWRFLIVVLAGGLANAIALYAMVSEDSALRVTTNLVDSPLALALFAVLGAAVGLGVRHRGWIAALVNNAGNFYAGFFEELTPKQIERQLSTNLVGPMNVTRAVLPAMRKQRSGHVISISSGAGLLGFEFCTAYAAAKHGIEGWMESLAAEVARFGIHTTIVNPGFFRSALLTNESTTYADPSIDDYADARAQLMGVVEGAERKAGR
jgi:NAD(P)-dependent dehydrogenase (short-subunit alcohol dehydrogenase family)